MDIFRPRPMQLHTQPKRATPIVLDHSLVQSTTDIRDEKNVEEDDDVITVPSPQKPSPRYRAERQSRTDWEALIRDKLAQKAWTTRDDGRCNRTIHLFATLHGHTPIGEIRVRHRHLGVTSDVLTCTISEAQKFVALVDTLPINGNMTIFITALQELLTG